MPSPAGMRRFIVQAAASISTRSLDLLHATHTVRPSVDGSAQVGVDLRVGAFALAPGSNDAAVFLTLMPGVYSAKLSGINRTSGEGLLEIYEVWP